jgi:hypothetical protein
VAAELPRAARAAALERVLRRVHPDRREAEVVGAVTTDRGHRVGVKVHPKGYLSTAKYALVTVGEGEVTDAEACTGRELRRALAGEAD